MPFICVVALSYTIERALIDMIIQITMYRCNLRSFALVMILVDVACADCAMWRLSWSVKRKVMRRR